MSLRQRIRRLVKGDPLSSCIRLNETVVFFPTVGRLVGGKKGERWKVAVHGRIYHPLEFSRLRRLGMRIVDRLAQMRGLKSEEAKAIFRERMAEFLADNERGNRIKVRVGEGEGLEGVWKLGRSRGSGHFHGEVDLAEGVGGEWVGFRALMKPGDGRLFAGRSLLVPAEGVSVISDIDDTVKVTEVYAGGMLRNTFAREFKGVPEMAGVYQRWAERFGRAGAFHYVSGSPWQMYPFLAAFLREQGFPEGSWHLRDFRLMPRDLLKTMRSSRRVKGRYCRELLRMFPERRFIFVGDSGESDPEMYAGLARAFPGQVERIYIRDVKGEGMGAARWGRTFAGLPSDLWRLFYSAAELS